MYLCRIHNPEQLRHISPGEFGKLLGLYRIPEARCLRARLKQTIQQNKSGQWGMAQANKWVKAEGTTIYYIDGHPKVYCGDSALGQKTSIELTFFYIATQQYEVIHKLIQEIIELKLKKPLRLKEEVFFEY